ncbi:prepilin peptidase [Phenylobacterium sp. LjRoot225]|uniref:prepilin peptidase n=1 Tax=Phenylobacterium sp. LjRoot225 TaxID=3342285 RepID=UPI003ECFA4FF
MSLIALLAFNAVLLCAAVSDVRHYRIPNLAPALLAIAGLVLAAPHSIGEALSRGGSLAVISLIAGALWLRGLLGGGDLKLLMACAVWIPLGGLSTFALALGLASGVQGLATLTFVRVIQRTPAASAVRERVPYGLSIAAAGLVWSLASSGHGLAV